MFYPEDMTAEDIMEFDYELNRIIAMERFEGEFWAENAELQILSTEFLAAQKSIADA